MMRRRWRLRRLKEPNGRQGFPALIEVWRLLAAKLRGDAEGKMSLSFVDELQAQVEKLEKAIVEAEAAGKDSGGDRVALSHLKALIEHFRGQVNKSQR